MQEHLSEPEPNMIESSTGFSVRVLGRTGMRPHELLEASLATCITISARMALADLGLAHGETRVRVRVHLEREESATRLRYELALGPALEPHRSARKARRSTPGTPGTSTAPARTLLPSHPWILPTENIHLSS
jgi:hypothetical protein